MRVRTYQLGLRVANKLKKYSQLTIIKINKMTAETAGNSVNLHVPAGFGDSSENIANAERCTRRWFRWSPTSVALLQAAEKRILSYMTTPYKGEHVNIGKIGKEECTIRTISMTENGNDKTPLVLVHGLCSGIGLWTLNLDEFAKHRAVYAFDLLGFGRSSRPKFSCDANKTESELVESIEKWREQMKLDRFVLLGHSMGGFVATSYAIQYPERVSHLILADPWGYSEKSEEALKKFQVPLWVRAIVNVWSHLNPLWILRAAGPWGPNFIKRGRPDLAMKFSVLGENADSNIMEYIYHCNSQTPSGEGAFQTLMDQFVWAKNPMINRISSIKENVPMTFLYGGRSYIDHCPEEVIREKRPNSFIDVKVIEGAGHHVYADNKEEFNKLVLRACNHVYSN